MIPRISCVLAFALLALVAAPVSATFCVPGTKPSDPPPPDPYPPQCEPRKCEAISMVTDSAGLGFLKPVITVRYE